MSSRFELVSDKGDVEAIEIRVTWRRSRLTGVVALCLAGDRARFGTYGQGKLGREAAVHRVWRAIR